LPEGLPEDVRQSQLGDILICAPVVVSEALELQRPESDHWAHLTIHGILHLLGYDHEQSAAAAVMESLETKILRNLGISDPYQVNL
jgi:probable rRNA maturation factor